MSQHYMNKNYKKSSNYPEQNQLLYIPNQYYDDLSNSSSIQDLLAPQYYQQKNSNCKKGNSSKSNYGYQVFNQIAYSQSSFNEEKHKNQQKKKQQKAQKQQNSSSFSLSQKLTLSSLSASKGIKIYVDGLCLFDKFSCKEVSPTEELFLQSSCSSQGSNTNSSINSSVTVTSSDDEKGNLSSTKYFATFSTFEGPDPSVLDPPTFQFQ
ncbi:hypothetical protein TTHERM_00717490 (macronuclear) [Tetrahymena thermophila SB210]|uniref:Uncharacterized protein n=1 Tax=Tetrahymena thermophila (strain SB210) TaxID=312017 RepID=Q23EC7_TETTS|nr:hypothetical protein TTHERM_00717490 [Tetrahymena thermophila SB210]EAR94826.1 hypothetical protein TTHERM_00717490 [Tetrahymena thermophila SB210]|eukprot:XP_001015071.1 hypothetical protein TTHERM_00717490 [Tetrahymena thermophila SB210]